MNSFAFVRLGVGLGLLAVCIVIHAICLEKLLGWFRRRRDRGDLNGAHAAWVLVQVAWWTVLAHLIEMLVWALAYRGLGLLPNMEVALYFSSVTYTTVGYGDVLLPLRWHILAGLEGLTGILMAGWSTAFLFAVMSRLLTPDEHGPPTSPTPS